jgi:hypothetical protein
VRFLRHYIMRSWRRAIGRLVERGAGLGMFTLEIVDHHCLMNLLSTTSIHSRATTLVFPADHGCRYPERLKSIIILPVSKLAIPSPLLFPQQALSSVAPSRGSRDAFHKHPEVSPSWPPNETVSNCPFLRHHCTPARATWTAQRRPRRRPS